jgi:hypothetical protein
MLRTLFQRSKVQLGTFPYVIPLNQSSSSATCDSTGTVLRAWNALVIAWLSVATTWLRAPSPFSDDFAFVNCVLVILG